MIWQRVLIVTAAVGNALAIVVPSLVLLIYAWGSFWVTSDPFAFLALVVVTVMGIPVMLFSVLNLWCVRSAWVLRGDKRARAIKWGLRSCAALAITGVVLSIGVYLPIPALVLAPIAYATATTLRHARAESNKDWLCQHCGYDLTGLERTKDSGWNGVCPECGTETGQEEKSPA